MKSVKLNINKKQADFLNLIQHEDAAKGDATAIKWCIDSCMKIEEMYKVDAYFISQHDIVLETLSCCEKDGYTDYNIKFYNRPNLMRVKANDFTMAGVFATAYMMLKGNARWGIEWIESDITHNKVPFTIE